MTNRPAGRPDGAFSFLEIAMSATREGVANRRTDAMAAIIKQHEANVDAELKESGQAEGIANLERGERAASTAKPDGVDQAEWDKLDQEAKAGLAEAEAERVKAEAEAIAGETDEQKAERERKEAEARKAAEAAAPPAKKVKIKVDGQELEVDEEQIRTAGIRTLQKETAADKRLEEATRLFKEAQAAIAVAQQGAVQDPNKGGASLPHAGGGAADVLTDEAFTEAVKKIQYGSEQEAGAILKDLITKAARAGQPEQLTLDRVAEMLDFRDATRWAHDEYKDILGDPKLKALFSSEEKRLRAAGDMRPYREVYKDIGDGLREWKKGFAPEPKQPANPGTSRETVKERKASVVVIPSAAARREAPPQPKEPTASQTIDKMREARHQK
jgi:hypothetical protein